MQNFEIRRRKFWVLVGPPKTFGHNMHPSILSRRAAVTEISIKKVPKNLGRKYLDPKLKNNWGPPSSTFHIERMLHGQILKYCIFFSNRFCKELARTIYFEFPTFLGHCDGGWIYLLMRKMGMIVWQFIDTAQHAPGSVISSIPYTCM